MEFTILPLSSMPEFEYLQNIAGKWIYMEFVSRAYHDSSYMAFPDEIMVVEGNFTYGSIVDDWYVTKLQLTLDHKLYKLYKENILLDVNL